LAALVSVVAASSALAAPSPRSTMTLFAGGGATAGWIKNSTLQLNETPTGYAGARIDDVNPAFPLQAPSFDERSTMSMSADGGSPRLVMELSDGGTIYLYNPETFLVPEPATQWDSTGGTAGFLYGVDYATAKADHPNATVTAVFIVTDSGWLKGGISYTNLITNIQYGGVVYTK
jgi:hypothetical protein